MSGLLTAIRENEATVDSVFPWLSDGDKKTETPAKGSKPVDKPGAKPTADAPELTLRQRANALGAELMHHNLGVYSEIVGKFTKTKAISKVSDKKLPELVELLEKALPSE